VLLACRDWPGHHARPFTDSQSSTSAGIVPVMW